MVLNDTALDKYKKKKSIFASRKMNQSSSLILDPEDHHGSPDKISQSLPHLAEKEKKAEEDQKIEPDTQPEGESQS